jgi:glutamyl-Q tRNA(Asp) synthetase
MPDSSYRGRFAPSPTGPLHAGSLLTAVASHAAARAAQGTWLVRIEDIDHERCRPQWTSEILTCLTAHSMVSDEPVLIQSERSAAYEAALKQLPTYRCTCTRSQLAQANRNHYGEVIYPNTCRDAQHTQGALRLRSDAAHDFVDQLQGKQIDHRVGDCVLRRADGQWAYQLAVVVDDAAQGISHVLRGDDLLASTPRQLALQSLLHLPHPSYAHLPVLRDTQGQKLSKQNKASAVDNNQALANLLTAWQALKQTLPKRPTSVAEFWALAPSHWRLAKCSPV